MHKWASGWLAGVLLWPLLPTLAAESKLQFEDDGHTLKVRASDDAHQVLDIIPQEAMQERLEWIDALGKAWAYVVLTDGKDAGLLFLDQKLVATVSRRDAQSFYACRAYATTRGEHWAHQIDAWMNSLLAAGQPTNAVTLVFSGQSTPFSIKEVSNDQTLSQLESLVSIGTNPFGILRKLNSANDRQRERDRLERLAQALRMVAPGSDESKLVEAVKPEEVRYETGAQVLAYPRFAWEFVVSNGVVRLAGQPSFHHLGQHRGSLFYQAKANWENCTPQNWRHWLPPELPPKP